MSGLIEYNLGIPASGHNPSNDYTLVQENTNATSQIVGVDHATFNVNFSGCHNQSTYLDQVSNPGSAAGQLRLYSKLDSSSISELYFQRDGNSSVIQLTGKVTPTASSSGYTFLPGGIILQWGVANISASTGTFTFPYNGMTSLFCATLGPSQGTTFWISSSSSTSVTVSRTGSGSSSCYVMVVGM